jgi:hypothetical protein
VGTKSFSLSPGVFFVLGVLGYFFVLGVFPYILVEVVKQFTFPTCQEIDPQKSVFSGELKKKPAPGRRGLVHNGD